MVRIGPDDKIYSVSLLGSIVDSLRREGIDERRALEGVGFSPRAMRSAGTRVSLNQFVQVCANAAELSADPHFAYHAGQRVHLSSYGMYGFAILSSTSFRQAIDFAMRYHQLAMPVIDISFHEERGRAIWTFRPIAHLNAEPHVFDFLVELHLSILTSLHRDVMGPSFVLLEIDFAFRRPRGAENYETMFGCPALFDKMENRLIYDGKFLDRQARLGDAIAHQETVKLCEQLMEQFQLRAGLAGRVRERLLRGRLAPTSFADIAKQLYMTERTLRRKLHQERTSFRALLDELRMRMAINYLRDTDLTVQEIAHSLGFGQAASFRHAFRRWKKAAPREFRHRLRSSTGRRARIA